MNRSAKGAEYKSQGQVPTLSGRRPWIIPQRCEAALKGRNTYFGLSGLDVKFFDPLPGATRSLRSRLPLAIILRAFGAAVHVLESRAFGAAVYVLESRAFGAATL
jgi:hypothetical protein